MNSYFSLSNFYDNLDSLSDIILLASYTAYLISKGNYFKVQKL